MDLKTYLSDKTDEERAQIAERAGTSANYLYHLCMGYRKPGAKMIRNIPAATDNAVTVDDLLRMSD